MVQDKTVIDRQKKEKVVTTAGGLIRKL